MNIATATLTSRSPPATTAAKPFHDQVAAKLSSYLDTLNDRSHPVVDHASPDEIRTAFATSTGITTGFEQICEPSHTEAQLLSAVDAILQYSVRTGHPQFYNQLFGRVNLVSMAGDWVSTTLNNNGHTFECSPVASTLESDLLAKVAAVVGGRYAEQGHDGIFVPGGSISNTYGMHLARARADPDSSTRGHSGGPRLVAYVSAAAHYSFLKAAKLCGIGSDNLIKVPVDPDTGGMSTVHLQRLIQHTLKTGGLPFFVGSTAGTTVTGSYDPFQEIADIAQQHNVDGCWGGSVILSQQHRALVSGIERR